MGLFPGLRWLSGGSESRREGSGGSSSRRLTISAPAWLVYSFPFFFGVGLGLATIVSVIGVEGCTAAALAGLPLGSRL